LDNDSYLDFPAAVRAAIGKGDAGNTSMHPQAEAGFRPGRVAA
jgi:hypothetical protein